MSSFGHQKTASPPFTKEHSSSARRGRPFRTRLSIVTTSISAVAAWALLAIGPASAQPVGVPAGSSGPVAAWGSNSSGQATVPPGLSGLTAIAAGGDHSLALKDDGTVAAWGEDTFGQADVPVSLTAVTAIAAGGSHSLALKDDGTVAAWGDNFFGQSTVPTGLSGVAAIAAGYYHSLALKSDGTVVGWGLDDKGQAMVPAGLSGVTAIAAGRSHSLALRGDGTVIAWGDSSSDQTSVPTGLTGVSAIAAGGFHSLALKGDGTVLAWGSNAYDITTVPASLHQVKAIAAGEYHSLALNSDGTVTGWGLDDDGRASIPTSLTDLVAIAAGGSHSLALQNKPLFPLFGADSPPTTAPAGEQVNYTFTATATPAATFAVSAGQLPPGLVLSSAGVLSGTPTVAGSYSFTVSASNNVLPNATGSPHTLVVEPGPLVATSLNSSALQVAPGGSITSTVSGVDRFGNIVDLTDQAVITSNSAVDVISGSTITFADAAPRTITATFGNLTTSTKIDVIAPTGAAFASNIPTADASASESGATRSLAFSGVNPLPAIVGGSGALLLGFMFGGLAWANRRRAKAKSSIR